MSVAPPSHLPQIIIIIIIIIAGHDDRPVLLVEVPVSVTDDHPVPVIIFDPLLLLLAILPIEDPLSGPPIMPIIDPHDSWIGSSNCGKQDMNIILYDTEKIP